MKAGDWSTVHRWRLNAPRKVCAAHRRLYPWSGDFSLREISIPEFSSVAAYMMVPRDPRTFYKVGIDHDWDGMKTNPSLSHLGDFMEYSQIFVRLQSAPYELLPKPPFVPAVQGLLGHN